MALPHNYITETAVNTNGMSNREAISFHYFNPNGLYERKKVLDEEINRVVDMGLVKNGCIIAHGSLNSFYYNRMRELFSKKRVRSIAYRVWLDGMRRDIDHGYEFLCRKV